MAKRWAHEHPGQKNLPEHKGKKKKASVLDAPSKATPVVGDKGGDEALASLKGYVRPGTPLAESSKHLEKESAGEEGEEGQGGPPNYRAAGLTGPRCGVCQHFRNDPSGGLCQKYATPVQTHGLCDSFQKAGQVGSGEVVGPVRAGGVQAPPGVEAPEAPEQPAGGMNLGQAFKYGFLYRCAEEGLDHTAMCDRVEQLLALRKQAQAGAANTALRTVGSSVVAPLGRGAVDLGLLALIGAPLAAGAVGGGLMAKLNKGDADPETLKTQELTDEYDRLAEEARQKRQLQAESAKGDLIRVS